MRSPTLLALVAILCAGSTALGQPVLHEYIPPPGQQDEGSPGSGALPDAIEVDGELLGRPEEPARALAGERLLGRGATPDRSTEVTPDAATSLDDVLHYTSEFNPSVVPYKRMSALDQVNEGYRLTVSNPALVPLPLTPSATPPNADAFWGSLALRATAGRPIPIPSVAANARILSFQTSPPAQVQFFKDSADNYWVKTDRTGTLRLIFLTDAPKRYFAPQIPPLATGRDIPLQLRPRLPAAVRESAAQVIARLGLPKNATLRRQLEALTAYFRSFQPGALPRLSGDIYLDIALSQHGVCRHRSLAFVITAQALGIPARYVFNEAHAFVEVFVPRMGWGRIDLGGASRELRVANGQNKALHQPGPDPFPQPDATLAARMTGIGTSQAAGRRRPGSGVNLSLYDGAASGRGAEGPQTSSSQAAAASPGAAPRDTPADTQADGELTDGQDPAPPEKPRRSSRITVQTSARVVFRGEALEVSGQVSAGGRGLAKMRVEIYLSRDGEVGDLLLGAATSAADGRYRLALPIPNGVAVGDYQIIAATPGDARHAPSLSR